MKHPERIEDYLEHIAEAIERATSYIQELDNVEALQQDHKTQAAVIRYIEIIGEAANRIQKQQPRNSLWPTLNYLGSRCAACATG